MPPDRAERVAAVVEEALEQPAEARAAFVAQACEDDANLAREVQSLLARETHVSEFIETPVAHIDPELLAAEPGAELRAGDMVASYKIMSLIGEGGMGEVYRAEDTQLGREVALKLVRPGVATRAIIARFRREERILAGLAHPNIAHIYGGGVTASGLPFFVMEYVVGERLDVYCSRRELSLRARLELFTNVCGAVSYAHQRLIVHRDLKPGNILVTAEGEPKLLDFGIATLLDDETPSSHTLTLRGVMTPDYGSPEQLRGDPITTATDVYSLGVVLHELLTGTKPMSAPATTQQLPSDVANIVRMALRPEPERRYASASEFAADIQRYLHDLPVIARSDTMRYRVRKFVARNRIAVAAALLIALSLIGGIIATMRESRIAQAERAKAEQRFADVRKLANSFLFEVHDAIERLPGSTPARELLVKRALEYLDKLARDAQGDTSLQRELVQAYIRVGNVQGNPTNSNLGDTAGALASYHKAAAIARKLAGQDPHSQRPLALVEEKTADVLAVTGDIAGALRSAQDSLAVFERIAASEPANPNAQQSLAISLIKVGDVSGNPNFPNTGDTAGAITRYRASLAIWQAQEKLEPGNAKVRRFLGLVHERLGTILIAGNDSAGALDHFRLSLGIREKLAADFPSDVEAVRDAAIAHEKIGDALTRTGDLVGALDNRTRSLAIFQRLLDLDPQNVYLQLSLAISHLHMAELLANPDAPNLGRGAEALQHCRAGIEILNSINADRANAKTRDTVAELTSLATRISR